MTPCWVVSFFGTLVSQKTRWYPGSRLMDKGGGGQYCRTEPLVESDAIPWADSVRIELTVWILCLSKNCLVLFGKAPLPSPNTLELVSEHQKTSLIKKWNHSFITSLKIKCTSCYLWKIRTLKCLTSIFILKKSFLLWLEKHFAFIQRMGSAPTVEKWKTRFFFKILRLSYCSLPRSTDNFHHLSSASPKSIHSSKLCR